jgi:hypothetical protein
MYTGIYERNFCLFVTLDLPNYAAACSTLGISWKALELNVLTYNEKAIKYTTTFSLKIHLNQR